VANCLKVDMPQLWRPAASLVGAARGGLSMLETKVVTEPTVKDYTRRYGEFKAFCALHLLPLGSRGSDEIALLEWADMVYLDGKPASDGTKTLAAFLHFHPERSRLAGAAMPRVSRALQAWGRLRPAHGRIPPAYPIICGIVCCLVRLGRSDMAVAALVALSGYLRPGELLGLRCRDVVAPMPMFGGGYSHWSLLLGPIDMRKPTKTGVYDDSVILDHPSLQWLGCELEKLMRYRNPDELLWLFSDQDFLRMFKLAAKMTNVGHLDLVPYSLRHAGPSWDALLRLRGQRDIQRRGRWRSPASVVRYERSSRVLAVLHELPGPTLHFLNLCELNLASFVRGDVLPPRPPTT
jgi:integrase